MIVASHGPALATARALCSLLVSSLLACTMVFGAGDSDRGALEAAMHRWITAVNARDADTLGTTMTEDVELLDTNTATVAGRNSAIRALREVVTRGQLIATRREITISHDIAWRVVQFTQTHEHGDVLSRGRALEIWKRVEGNWQLHRQVAAGILAPAVSLTRPSTSEPVLDRPSN